MVADESTLGVPVITPVWVLNTSPVGSEGLIDQAVKLPATVGVIGVIAPSRANGATVAYEIERALTDAVTSKVTVVVAVPPVFVAVTVYVALDVAAVGVPEIKPVAASKLIPAGRGGEIVHVAAEPVFVGTKLDIAEPVGTETVDGA